MPNLYARSIFLASYIVDDDDSTPSPIVTLTPLQIGSLDWLSKVRTRKGNTYTIMSKIAPAALTRRCSSFLWLGVLLFIAFFFFGIRSSDDGRTSPWRSPFTTDDGLLSFIGYGGGGKASKEPTRIAILESAGVHDEVSAALVHAFGGQANSELSLYLAKQRYHSDKIINNFTLEAPIVGINNSLLFEEHVNTLPAPHVLVSTTCELDLIRDDIKRPLDKLLHNSTTHLFCLVHHADRWKDGKHVDVVRSWPADRIDFIGLSQHTVDFFKSKTLSEWHLNETVTMRTFPPVFPVALPEPDPSAGLSLAMQGDYSSGRRDYKGIFEHLGEVIHKVKEANFATDEKTVSLHLIGHGNPPEVPENVRDHVVFDQSLSYPDFYALLSKAFSILPAFASDTYFDRKASSTVPASLIAGAPLVASEELLKAYSYLPREVTWVAEPGETEMATIRRVIVDRDAYIQKRQAVRDACVRLAEENRGHVKEWIAEALANVKTQS